MVYKKFVKEKNVRAYVMLMLMLSLICMAPIYEICGFVTLVFFVATYVSAQRINESLNFIRFLVKSKKDIIVLVCVYVYTLFSFFGMIVLEEDYLDTFILPNILYLPILILWTFPIYIYGIQFIHRMFARFFIKESKSMSNKMYIVMFGLLILNYLIWLYAYNPCITSVDSADIYNQAHNMREVPMLDWHPPFYAIVIRMLLKIYDSITFLVIIQCVFFALVYMNFIKYMYNKGVSTKIIMIIYVLGGFSFNNTIQMITLWKDIPYMVSLMWLTILCVKIVVDYNVYSNRISWYIRIIIALTFTSLFRQNGILPAVGTAVVLTVYMLYKKNKSFLLVLASFFSIFVFIKGPVYSFYKVESANGLKYFAMANDVVCLDEEGYSLSKESKDIVDQVKQEERKYSGYSPYYAKYNRYAFEDYSMSKFIKGYMSAFVNHPVQLSLNVLRRNAVVWSVFVAKGEILGCENYTGECLIDKYEHVYPARKTNIFTHFFNVMCQFLSKYLTIFAWKTGIYLLVILYCGVYIVKRKTIRKYIIICVPILLNICALVIGSGWSDYRYFWPTEMISYVIFVVTVYIVAKNKSIIEGEKV